MANSTRFFKGSELPRLLVLLVILVFGLVATYEYVYYKQNQPVPEPELLVAGLPAPIVPDNGPEFETVTDKTPLGLRDMAAYHKLLERARATSSAELDKEARRDIFYSHLWDRPEHYRGVPIHLLGTARRVLHYESKKAKNGWINEAWVFSSDSPTSPYCCVFEDAPKGLPIGANIAERVIFNGYFLKLMKYEASDSPRGAAVLIGRIGWTAPPPHAKNGDAGVLGHGTLFWFGLALAVMFCLSLMRWIIGLKRAMAPRSSIAERVRLHPKEEIHPDELAQWVESAPHLEDEPEEGSEADEHPG